MSRRITKLPEVVYHGTTDVDYNNLKNGIDLKKGRKNLDFGKGFYATSSYAQASSWARTKAVFANNENQINNSEAKNIKIIKPHIVKYKVDIEKLERLNGVIFGSPDKEWAKCILDNRLGNYGNYGIDYIYGHLADSRIALPLMKYRKGEINFEEFHKVICPVNIQYEDQICFLTDESIKCLERS